MKVALMLVIYGRSHGSASLKIARCCWVCLDERFAFHSQTHLSRIDRRQSCCGFGPQPNHQSRCLFIASALVSRTTAYSQVHFSNMKLILLNTWYNLKPIINQNHATKLNKFTFKLVNKFCNKENSRKTFNV